MKFKTIIFSLLIAITIISCSKPQVENLGIFMPHRLNDVAGQDGCTPIPFGKNKILWTFGDTILGTWKKKVTVDSTFSSSAIMKAMLSNSIALSSGFQKDSSKMSLGFYKKQKKVSEFIPFKRGENPFKIRFWPGDGIIIKNKLFIYYTLVKIIKAPVPFKTGGTGIVSYTIGNNNLSTLNNLNFKRHKLLFGSSAPHFGDAVIKHREWLYVLGRKKSADKKSVWLSLARVKPSHITNSSSYSFLKKDTTWTRNPMKTDLIKHFAAGEASLSFNNELKSFIIIFMGRDGILKALMFKNIENIYKGKLIKLYTPPLLKNVKKNSLQIYYSGKEVYSDKKNIFCIYIHPLIYQPMLVKIPITKFILNKS